MVKTYKEAGVDIEKGDRFASFIRNIGLSSVSLGIGGFAEGVEIPAGKYRHPVILSTTDGVGTKLLIARKAGKFDSIGIDLVAMCANDLLACGALPVSFLDYIACGEIEETVLQDIIYGVAEGCAQAGCVLSGGETAEMPDMYNPGDFDLAGFCWGIVEKEQRLPHLEKIHAGDRILGIPSSGIHSNGFSLARKNLPTEEPAIQQELLIPTRIYTKEITALTKTGMVFAAAHITGGGLAGNISRVLPDGFIPELRWDWSVPEIFDMIREHGDIRLQEMRRVFNMGIGMAIVTAKDSAPVLLSLAEESEFELLDIGEVR